MRSTISWDDLQALAPELGDGFWILDLDQFRDNLTAFRRAFVAAGWNDTTIGWSVKTLWLPHVVRAAAASGAHTEVVSRHEYEFALSLGVDPTDIIFNGPLKSRDDLARASALGSIIHLDSNDEVADIVALAQQSRAHSFRVGLRANIDFGLPERSRFGLDAESGDLQHAFRVLAAEPNVIVDGLHMHSSSARGAETYTRRIERLVRLAEELWPNDTGLRHIDLGGGFSGALPASLAAQLGNPGTTFAEYAEAVVPTLKARWPTGGPRLLLEPGIALAADAMSFAARVGATKTIAGRHHAIVNSSIYTVKPTLHDFDMPMDVLCANGEVPPPGHTQVSGWTCAEGDVLARDCGHQLQRGDWLLFDNCGAYSFVLSPSFIRPTPAVVTRAVDGAWEVVRSADTVADWLAPFETTT